MLFAGLEVYSFETVQGLRFHYKIRGKELFFSRKEKSVIRATVDKAVKTVLDLQRQRNEISGPKKLTVLERVICIRFL